MLEITSVPQDRSYRADGLSENNESRYSTLVQATHAITWTTNPQGAFIDPQVTWQAFTGQTWEQCQAFNWIEAVHPEDKDSLMDIWRQAVRAKSIYQNIARVWSQQDNNFRYVLIRAVPLKNDNADIQEWVGSCLDIHDLKETEAKLRTVTEQLTSTLNATKNDERQRAEAAEEMRKQQERFVDRICHEIRNPLNGLIGGSTLLNDTWRRLKDLLKEENNKFDPQTARLIAELMKKIEEQKEIITQCATQQKRIIDDVLDYSKLNNQLLQLNPIPFDLKLTMTQIRTMVAAQVEQKNLLLDINIKPDVENFLKADEHRFTQVMINLISNAIKFTRKGGITVLISQETISQQEKILKVEVKDTGIGMTPVEMSNLFQAFAQANSKVASEYGGTGLGLALSKDLINLMGGEITVDSQQGQGSSFCFTIRCQTLSPEEIEQMQLTKNQQADANPTDFINLKGKTFLVVEDNEVNQKILIRFLEQLGCSYEVANNGCEALMKCEQFKFDCILMDIEMPELDGIATTRQLREIEKRAGKTLTPIIGLSAKTRQDQIDAGIQAGMDAYLTKPYDLKEMLQLISRLIKLPAVSVNPIKAATSQEFIKGDSTVTPNSLMNTAVECFKIAAADMLQQHYNFEIVHKSDRQLVIRLPQENQKYLITSYVGKLILQQLKQYLKKAINFVTLDSLNVYADSLIVTALNKTDLPDLQAFFVATGLMAARPLYQSDPYAFNRYVGSVFSSKRLCDDTNSMDNHSEKRIKLTPLDSQPEILQCVNLNVEDEIIRDDKIAAAIIGGQVMQKTNFCYKN